MGEIADDHMDRLFGHFDSYFEDDEDDEWGGRQPTRSRGVTCRRCSAAGLSWSSHAWGREYVLRNPDGSQHVCPPADADEFDVVA